MNASNAASRIDVATAQINHDPSWMLPEAKNEELLYVANYYTNVVRVYSYPAGKLVGSLTTDIYVPDGVCVDKQNDVWIVDNAEASGGAHLVEYEHGGTKPIATLDDNLEYSETCSVDPTTGTLAVTNYSDYANGPGSVSIYAHAKGSPKIYVDSKITTMYFCGYDPNGNLFLDGISTDGHFQLAEIAKGKNTFTNIALKGGTIYYPGQVQWDGKHLAVGDQEAGSTISHYTYSAIYQTTGAGGKIVGETPLDNSLDVAGFWIAGNTVVAPNAPELASQSGGNVYFYKYPSGGKPTKNLKHGFSNPLGLAISQ
ncbi:MAG: hypothetical protein WA814_12000 [Candidatus Baltobacteraceae bacterium]